jgi:hypothetical protein
MTRNDFLNLNFPLLPYCEPKRHPSTQFNEGFGFTNKYIGITLNFGYRCDDTVSVWYFNHKEKNPYEKYKTIIEKTEELSNEQINEICNKYLK